MSTDNDQLKLLSIFYYILGGLSAFFSCIPIIHLGMGIAILTGQFPMPDQGGPPPELIGWLFIGFASVFMLIGWTYSICLLMTGRCLQQHRGYTFCFIIAALSCLSVPIGTCLGIFTIIVLNRPNVKMLFENSAATDSEWGSTDTEQQRTETDRFDSSSTF